MSASAVSDRASQEAFSAKGIVAVVGILPVSTNGSSASMRSCRCSCWLLTSENLPIAVGDLTDKGIAMVVVSLPFGATHASSQLQLMVRCIGRKLQSPTIASPVRSYCLGHVFQVFHVISLSTDSCQEMRTITFLLIFSSLPSSPFIPTTPPVYNGC